MDMPYAVIEAGLANKKETTVGFQLVSVDFEAEAAFADICHGEVFCLLHPGGGAIFTLAQEVVYGADWRLVDGFDLRFHGGEVRVFEWYGVKLEGDCDNSMSVGAWQITASNSLSMYPAGKYSAGIVYLRHMRWLIYLFSVYILVLSGIPCKAADNCCADEIALTHPSQDQDTGDQKRPSPCAPFFTCGAYHGVVVPDGPAHVMVSVPAPRITYPSYADGLLHRHHVAVWQPPKMAIPA